MHWFVSTYSNLCLWRWFCEGKKKNHCPYCFSSIGCIARTVSSPNQHLLRTDDVISCCLDLSAPSISFRINGQPVQGMFENFNIDGLFFPVVSFSAGIKLVFLCVLVCVPSDFSYFPRRLHCHAPCSARLLPHSWVSVPRAFFLFLGGRGKIHPRGMSWEAECFVHLFYHLDGAVCWPYPKSVSWNISSLFQFTFLFKKGKWTTVHKKIPLISLYFINFPFLVIILPHPTPNPLIFIETKWIFFVAAYQVKISPLCVTLYLLHL